MNKYIVNADGRRSNADFRRYNSRPSACNLRLSALVSLFNFLFFSFIFTSFAEETPQKFEGFNLSGYTQSGSKSWDVKGDTANVSGNVIQLTNINANAYGELKANVTAKRGNINKESGNMHLEKDVVITSETGAQLTTDSLDWQRDNDLVRTDDPVKITDKGMVTTGTGIVAHPNLKLAQLNENVTVNIKPETKDEGSKGANTPVMITCDGPLEIDQAKQMAVFNDNVVATQEGRELKADKVEVYFDQTTQKIKEMISTGNVAIRQGGNVSYSDKAIYRAAEQKLILSGRPKLIMDTEGNNSIASFGDEKSN